MILHIVNFSYGMSGKLDSYTLTIMIHEALLTNGFQLIHTLRRLDRPHWKYFVINWGLTTVEFVFATTAGTTGLINRNLNECTSLKTGLKSQQAHRFSFTIFPYCIACFLCLADVLIWFIDGYRNRGKPESLFTRYIRPNWLIWDDKIWNRSRLIICLVGFTWWTFSVITLEVFIIRDFHIYMLQFSGSVSSTEDAWSYGQIMPLCCALVGFGYAIRQWFLEVMANYVRERSGMGY
jgi:hypothetical protein